MIFNRLELDVMQHKELNESVEIAFKHKCPAIVVHPNLVGDAMQCRGRVRGKFKIITPVDWPRGDVFNTLKFRGLSTDAIEADGFEIMLTGGKTEGETRQEATALTEFVKNQIDPQTEVRFVLGTCVRDEQAILGLCRGLLGVRTPAFIRTDTQLKLQVSKANTEEHNRMVTLIRSVIQAPIKVAGNINGVRVVTGCQNVARFGVNLLQAKTIIKEFNQQPDGLQDLLDDSLEAESTEEPKDVSEV